MYRKINFLNSIDNFHEKSSVCERGFYITNSKEDITEFVSFVTSWKKSSLDDFVFYVHPNQQAYMKSFDSKHYFLIGHAYNPYDGVIDEDQLLQKICEKEEKGQTEVLDYINSLTGIFLLGKIDAGSITILLDCAGMTSGFYGVVNNTIVVSSHTVIPSQVFALEASEYVTKLVNYKFYNLYGSFLPGDITPYTCIKRVIPNTIVKIEKVTGKIQIERFYPDKPLQMVSSEEAYQLKIDEISNVLIKTMECISKKWSRPGISLTGGMDSKTTLSACNGFYDHFSYFSYITSKAEKLDADAAHGICEALGLPHKVYSISQNPLDYGESFNTTRDVLLYNKDYIGKNNTNDICKRIFFKNTDDFDVEVKSWVSEIARANYYKKFGKKKMPKRITPRRCSCMYKIFLHNRKLLHETDRVFSEYIEKTNLTGHLYNYDWSDLFLWEIRYGAWGGLVITAEHKYSYEITIPYNNRKLLELMLSTPLEKRIKDSLHSDLIDKMNSVITDTKINVVNMNETKFREVMEKIYFNINSNLPF